VKGPFIFETTATTGTGTITLGGALDGYIAFNDHFRDGDVVMYVIRDGNEFEIGQGVFTASGTTLSRDAIHATLDAGVYDITSPTAISLSGNAVVTCDFTHRSIDYNYPGLVSTLPFQISWHLTGGTNSGKSITAGREYYTPFFWLGGDCDSISIGVITAGAGDVSQAIYACDETGNPGALIVDAGTVSIATTGLKTASFTAVRMDPGWYYTYLQTDISPVFDGIDQVLHGSNVLGVFEHINLTYQYKAGTYSATAPSPASTGLSLDIARAPIQMLGVA